MALSEVKGNRIVNITTDLHPVIRRRINGAMPPTHSIFFTDLYSVKHRDQLPFASPVAPLHQRVQSFPKASNKKVVFPVRGMKMYKGSRGMAPVILELGSGRKKVIKFTPQPVFSG